MLHCLTRLPKSLGLLVAALLCLSPVVAHAAGKVFVLVKNDGSVRLTGDDANNSVSIGQTPGGVLEITAYRRDDPGTGR